MPTKISLLRGIGKNVSSGSTATKRVGRGARARKRFFNFAKMTEGQFLLYQLDWQLEILERYYADPLKTYEQGRNLIYNSINSGLHSGLGVGTFTGYIPEEIKNVARAIRSAKSMTRPTGKFIDRRVITKIGMDPIAEFEIPPQECIDIANTYGEVYPGGPVITQDQAYENYLQCLEQNGYIQILNDNLGESAHHMLYEFVSNPNSQPSAVATKTILQKLAISKIADVTDLSRSNMKLWVRNGVMYSNTLQGTEPFSPEESIIAVQRSEAEGINDLTVAAIVAIITAVGSALAGAAALINSFKQSDQQLLRQNLTGFSTPEFGPQGEDWANSVYNPNNPNSPLNPNNPGNSSGGFDTSKLVPLALGGAGLFLLLNNNNSK